MTPKKYDLLVTVYIKVKKKRFNAIIEGFTTVANLCHAIGN